MECDSMAGKEPVMVCVDPYDVENVNGLFMGDLIN